MSIIKNEIPLLEYDDTEVSMIMPGHEDLGIVLPEKAVFAFLGERIDEYAKQNHAEVISEFVSITKNYPIYVVEYNGEDVCLCQAPAGAAAAVQLLDWLIGYGVKKVISAGSCGALTDLPENALLLPEKALRDEGASYHYLPPSRWIELNKKVLDSMENTLKNLDLPYIKCATWSTDGFFRETREKIEYRKAEGIAVVEMECSALAACAQFRGIEFGQLLFTADSLADGHDERGWGADSLEKALLLCLAFVSDLG